MPTICPAGICRMPTKCPQGTVQYAIYMSCMGGLPFSTAGVLMRSGRNRPVSLSDIFDKSHNMPTICPEDIFRMSSIRHPASERPEGG